MVWNILFKSWIQDILGLRMGTWLTKSKTTCSKSSTSIASMWGQCAGHIVMWSPEYKAQINVIVRPQIWIWKRKGKYIHWPLFAPVTSDIPDEHSFVASWCLVKAGNTFWLLLQPGVLSHFHLPVSSQPCFQKPCPHRNYLEQQCPTF